MRDSYPIFSLMDYCRLLGISRQAYYQHFWHKEKTDTEQVMLLEEIRKIRKQQPAVGARKLHLMLQPFLSEHHIKMGRDCLFNFLAAHKMLVRRRKKRIYTTQSSHWLRKYPNLIRNMTIRRPNQLWVADITYYKTLSGCIYINMITDAYSHKILGHCVSENMEASNNIKSLEIALKTLGNQVRFNSLTHHSDRGVQYCSNDYVRLLQTNSIAISMTQDGDPLENAVAERINGIIKQEYLDHYKINDLADAIKIMDRSVKIYNQQRLHLSCNLQTPEDVHHQNLPVKKLWKNYYKKKNTDSAINAE